MSSTMDPDTVLLNTLHQDLPDPDVLLHVQVILELDKFEPFPKLPIELRLIWKMTFKPRKIRVALVCESLRYSWDRGVVGLESRTREPSVLHVSQESRLVGLQHYFALLRDHQRTHCVIYVNPEIDTVALYQGRKDSWLSSHHYLPARLWTALQKIQCLEMHGAWWDRVFGDMLRGTGSDPWANDKWLHSSLFFVRLTGLRELHLVESLKMNLRQANGGFSTEEGRTDGKEAIKSWFTRRSTIIPETKIPEVILVL